MTSARTPFARVSPLNMHEQRLNDMQLMGNKHVTITWFGRPTSQIDKGCRNPMNTTTAVTPDTLGT